MNYKYVYFVHKTIITHICIVDKTIYLGDIASRYSVNNTFALRVMFKNLAESVKQPISFTRIANIVSLTGVKVGTQTIINYIEYAKEQKLNIGDAVIDVVPI